jgi:phospholipid/cholesterol/gamma-HCH transport system permease protein
MTPGVLPDFTGFDPRHRRLLTLVEARPGLPPPPAGHHWIWRLGRAGYRLELAVRGVLAFFGLLAIELARAIGTAGLRWRETLIQGRHSGLEAIPVIALITCLIGVVVAYLLGLQATKYGANVFVIDGVAIGMVREFSPLLVATIVAGRSGAAFTAQLGTMKLAQEIDAIRMTGLSAEQVLVVPRVLALVATLPLLVFLGDVAGLAGAAAVCHWMLDLTPATFVDRVQSELGLTHFVVGLVKAPVFAFAIALIGCHKGMAVARDTRAIGAATTETVVHAIVAVIVLDALFAVALQALGI